MTFDIQLIIARRRELEADIERLRKEIADSETELSDLVTAERVMQRLSGAERAESVEDNAEPAPQASGSKPDGLPTMNRMVESVMKEVGGALEPKEIADAIRKRWWPDMPGNRVNTIVYKMKQDGRIIQVDGTSTYRLPQTDEAPDENLGGGTSGASLFETQAKGREAVPGGGT